MLRILPFAAAWGFVALVWRPRWIGFSVGDLGAQVTFAAFAVPAFAIAMYLRWRLARTSGVLVAPGNAASAAVEGGFYLVNGPVEEAFFRGLMQGGVGVLAGAPIGFVVATAAYVLYHRLGGWSWRATFSTAFLGVPVGLAFWLLPGPPSLLGVSIVHIAATSGFLGPGPFLLRRFIVA